MITRQLIASCGMNCGVCRAYLREKNKCPGCNNSPTIPSCQKCFIKLCKKRTGKFCFECAEFPCDKLKHMDKRYQTKYGMSEIENLEAIQKRGIDSFVKSECQRWQSEKGIFCVHDKEYYP